MLCRWIIALILFGLTAIPSFSQKVSPPKTPALSAEQIERDNQIKNQALFLLRDNLSRARSITNFRQRAYVIREASSVLWDYDRPTAEDYLVGFINQSLADYKDLLAKEKRTADENKATDELDGALQQALKVITQKDPKSASLLRSKYFKVREDGLRPKNLSDEMEMAADGMDVDEQRTVSLLMAIIQQGVPDDFPKLINDLEAKRPAIAESLVQRAIQNLAVNSAYKASDAINLSALIFNENEITIPLSNIPGSPNSVGLYVGGLERSKTPPGREIISDYFTAVQGFFNSRLIDRSAGVFDSDQNLIQSYFLLEKLKAYTPAYNVIDPDILDRFLIPLLASMQTAGFSAQTLSNIKGYAYRQATTNNPIDLDDGTRAFEKADDAKTPEEKLGYLIEGIIAAIEFRQFAKAEWKIIDVQDAEIKDALYLLLNMRAGLDAIQNKNWSEFEKRTEKLTDKSIRAFLYLKAISVFESGKSHRPQLTEYVIKAEKNINDIADKTAKASALVTLASLLLSLDNTETIRDVPSAIYSVNDAPDYAENNFSIRVTIPKRGFYGEYIGENSFKTVFSKLAEADWTNAQVQALQVKRTGLQAIAQIVAAKIILNKKTLLK